MKTITHDGKEYEFDCYENGKITYKEIKKDFGLQGFDDGKGFSFVTSQGSCSTSWETGSLTRCIENFVTYPDLETAKKASKLMQISNAFIKACLLVDPDFEPDFSDFSQDKYRIYYDLNYDIFTYIETDNAGGPVVSSVKKVVESARLLRSWGIDKLIDSLGDK